jgi:hypothetical protein
MRRVPSSIAALAITLFPAFAAAQGGAAAQAGDASHAVAGGGIMVPGWQGRIDAAEATRGGTIQQTKLTKEGEALHVITGPAAAFWLPTNTASGNYTVKATFHEPEFMNANSHAHPYGVFIGGNDMGTDGQTYLYCAAYGTGNFIVRGFGPAAFQMNGKGAGEPNAAVHKAEAKGKEVTQEVAINVLADKVECAINGTVVASYPKADIVGAGKLKSTDGVYGIRFAHNTDAHVIGLTMTKK